MSDSSFRPFAELYEMIWHMQTEENSIGFVLLKEFIYDWANYIGYLSTRFPLEKYTLPIKVPICSYFLYLLSNT